MNPNQFLRTNVQFSPTALPVSKNSKILYCLIHLNPAINAQVSAMPLDVRMVLDNSGSMSEKARGSGNETKLALLKKACKGAVKSLKKGDKVTIYSFSDSTKVVLAPFLVKDPGDYGTVKNAIDKIGYGGGTHMSTALSKTIAFPKNNNTAQRVIIFTDGEVNIPSPKAEEDSCVKLADNARQKRASFWVYGTGITYNEKFLRELAERSGGQFQHVSEPKNLQSVFKDMLDCFNNVAITNVHITAEAAPGVIFRKLGQVIPVIQQFKGFQESYASFDIPDVDSIRGAALLLQMEILPAAEGSMKLGELRISYDVPSAGIFQDEHTENIEIKITNDLSLVKTNKQVVDAATMQSAHDLTTQASETAMTGKIGSATQLMNEAAALYSNLGEDDIAEKLFTLSNQVAQNQGETGDNIDARRTLNTISSQLITKRLTNSEN